MKQLSKQDREMLENLTAHTLTIQELLELIVEQDVSADAISYLTAIYRHTNQMKATLSERRKDYKTPMEVTQYV